MKLIQCEIKSPVVPGGSPQRTLAMAAVAAISISARWLCGQLVHVCMRKHALLLHSSHGAFGLFNMRASDIYVGILWGFFLNLFLGKDKQEALRDQWDGARKTSSALFCFKPSTPNPSDLRFDSRIWFRPPWDLQLLVQSRQGQVSRKQNLLILLRLPNEQAHARGGCLISSSELSDRKKQKNKKQKCH